MNNLRRPGGRPRQPRARGSSSGTSGLKLHRSISDRWKAKRFARATQKATYLSTLPKERWKRILFRLQPSRVAKYWFSREGGIMALKVIGIGIVVMFLLVIGLFAYFRKDLPKINDISGDKIGGSITYYDRTGTTVLWQDNNGVKRIPVQGDQMAQIMREATVATEDKNFYKEGAFSVSGILRAGLHDVFGGGGVQGGSTITQQLVKLNEQWTDNRTITRKVKELILAVELEREYSKDQILTAYLNVAPYGGVEYGVESAARDYFGVGAKDLTLPEAAFLAAIPKSPSIYSPYNSTKWNPAASNTFDADGLKARMDYIYGQMVTQHYITQDQANAAEKVDVLSLVKPLENKYSNIIAPYFVQAAKQELINKYGSSTVNLGGWKVITTLNLKLQNQAEQLVQSNLPKIMRLTGGAADEEATVAEDVPTGQILALVGGTNFSQPQYGQNNYAASIQIPPGSSFKPYDYSTLIQNNNNVGAGSVLYDTQQPLPGYPCTNKQRPFIHDVATGGNCLWDYDFKYPGPLTLRYALGGSRNVPAVKAMLSALPNDNSNGKTKSIDKVQSTATAMMDNPYASGNTYNCYQPGDVNLTKTSQCYASAAIGDGGYLYLDDHVNGLATLGRLGNAIPRTYILKIQDASSKTIYQWQQPKGTQVINKDTAYIVDNMLSDPNASYLPGSCSATNCTPLSDFGYKFQHDNGSQFAVKTGTTNDGYDGLMTSWSSNFAVVSWTGNHNRNKDLSAYSGAAMETLTEPLTRGLMEAAQADSGKPPAKWTQPSDIKVEPAFVVRNHIDFGDIEPSPEKDLYPSWYIGNSTESSQTIDKVSGKLATNCTPALARSTEANSNAASWNIDYWMGGTPNIASKSSTTGSTAAQATDDVHSCSDAPPSVTLTVTNNSDGTVNSTCDSGGCTIAVAVSGGTHPLSGGSYTTAPAGTVTVSINGQTAHTFTMDQGGGAYNGSFIYEPTSSGTETVTATAVDSVLYSGSNSESITFTAPSTITLGETYDPGSGIATFNWTGGTGTVTVYKVSGPGAGTLVCSSSGSSCKSDKSGSKSVNSGDQVYAQDSNGDKSSTITIT